MAHTKKTYQSDEEFLSHLYEKADQSEDDMESALRIELLMNSYHGLLENVHTLASIGLSKDPRQALIAIREMTSMRNETASVSATLN